MTQIHDGTETHHLFAFLDESGSTSRPGISDFHDFSLGGVLINAPQLSMLFEIDQRLKAITGKSDYKYKHVLKSKAGLTEWRKLIRRGALLTYGFYSSGHAMLNEAERTQRVTQSRATAKRSDRLARIRENPTEESLLSFMKFSFPCFAHLAASVGVPICVYMDRRSDIDVFTNAWDGHCADLRGVRPEMDVRPYLTFNGTFPEIARPGCRVAGVIAGAVCDAMRKSIKHIAALLRSDGFKDGHSESEMRRILRSRVRLPYRGMIQIPAEYSPVFAAIQTRMMADLLSFATAEGIMGHMHHEGADRWSIWQLPD